MDELTRVLWEYASRYRLDGFYDREAQQSRDECARAVEQNRAALEELSPPDVFRRVSARMMAGFSPEELHQLAQFQRRMLDNLTAPDSHNKE